ncbi:hypothetical protein BsWGS_19973 [Bradybaena similaris]
MTTEHPTDSSCAPEKPIDKTEVMKTVSDLMSQGKRSMVCGEIPQAVNLYEEAVQLLVKSCGELSRDCADAYFCCGSALLELGRMETNVLGVALEGVEIEEEKDVESSEQFEKPPEDDGEERHKLREDVYEAMAEGDREEVFVQKAEGDSVGNGDTRTEVTGVETDKAEKALTQLADGDSQLAASATKSSSTGTDSSTSNQVTTGHHETASADKEQLVTTGDHNEDNTADMKEVKSDTPASDSTSATEKQAGNQQDQDVSAKDNTEATTAASHDEKTDTLAKAASEEEQMDTSPTMGEEPTATEGEKVNEGSKTDDSAAQKAALEAGSCTDSAAAVENTAGVKPSEHVADTADVEKEKCAEHIVTEAVKEACQKLADEAANSQECSGEAAGDGPGAAGEENADVEMADGDEAMDESDDDASDNEENGEEKADDVPNFQLAWEYLELAKVLYLKSESVDDQLKAAECHIKLGELSMETEQYTTAAGDLAEALQIQQKHLPANNRLLAETHYQLGLAYGLNYQYEQSIQQYTTAIGILESKIGMATVPCLVCLETLVCSDHGPVLCLSCPR